MAACFLGPKGCGGAVSAAPPAPDVPWARYFVADTHYCEAHQNESTSRARERMRVSASERQRQWLASEGLA